MVNIFPCGICTNEVENDDHSVQNHTECVNISSLNYQNSLTSKDLKYVLTGLSSHTIVNLDQKQTDSKKTKNLKNTKKSMTYLDNLKLQSPLTITLRQQSENLKQR